MIGKIYRFLGFALVGLAATTVTGLTLELRKRNTLRKLLKDAADEGYEIAYDIKFPKIHGLRQKTRNLKYGPVYPS